MRGSAQREALVLRRDATQTAQRATVTDPDRVAGPGRSRDLATTINLVASLRSG